MRELHTYLDVSQREDCVVGTPNLYRYVPKYTNRLDQKPM